MGVTATTRNALIGGLLAAAVLFPGKSDLKAQQQLSATDYGDVDVFVTSMFGSLPVGGYAPVQVEIKNKSKNKATLNFQFEASTNAYRSPGTFESSFQLSADADSTASHEILVPVPLQLINRYYGGSGCSLNVRMSGSGFPTRRGNMYSDIGLQYPCVAMSPESRRLGWDDVKTRLTSSHVRHHGSSDFGARFTPETLPSNWLGYSGFDAMVIEEREWSSVEPPDRAAILDWVRVGGRLIVWTKESEMKSIGIERGDTGLGSIEFVRNVQLQRGNRNRNNTIRDIHFAKPRNFRLEQIENDYQGGWSLYRNFGRKSFNTVQIVFILIAFGILVGPVNLFVFAKPGKRHRLFFTTPLISIGASLVLALLIVVQDGFGGSGARIVATYIDSTDHKSYSFQEQVTRTGVLLSRSFEVAEPTAVLPVRMVDNRWTFVNGEMRSRSLRFSQSGKTLAGDWFRSRSEQGHQARTVRSTRERVEIIPGKEGDFPELVSSIAYPLKSVYYIDGDGEIFRAANVGTGQKVKLRPSADNDFEKFWAQATNGAGNKMQTVLDFAANAENRKGRFFAVGDEDASGHEIDTLGSIQWRMTSQVVFGEAETTSGGSEGTPAL